MIIAKDVEVGFKPLIYAFCLAICLEMKGGIFLWVDFEDGSQCGSKA